VSYTRKGKSSSKFVKKEDLPVVRKQLKNYSNRDSKCSQEAGF
jgi:cobalamin biosynthesis protein CobD/CbiB